MRSRWLFSCLAILALSLMAVSPLHASHMATGNPAPAAPADPHAGHGQTAAPAPDHSAHQAAPPTESGSASTSGDMAAMQQQAAVKARIDELRASMNTIKASTNAEERKQLMQAHLAAMTDSLTMLNKTGCGAMMQSGRCPMMAGMQHGQSQGGGMHHGAGMAMGQGGMGGMGGGKMGQCHMMMQMRSELTASLMEQIIEMQAQMLADSGK